MLTGTFKNVQKGGRTEIILPALGVKDKGWKKHCAMVQQVIEHSGRRRMYQGADVPSEERKAHVYCRNGRVSPRCVVRSTKTVSSDTIRHSNVQDEFSVYRPLRRGATSEAQNAQIPQDVIEANNRWRKLCRSKGLTPGGSMMK
jgi:hypothetical protein